MNIILSSPTDYYVLQVASLPEKVDLEVAVKKLGLSKQLVAVKTVVDDRKHWVILEGIYQNIDEAHFASIQLKENSPKIEPWPRTIGSLKNVLAIQSIQY